MTETDKSYGWADARRDAERIESFMKRLTGARQMFDAVSLAKKELRELRGEIEVVETELASARETARAEADGHGRQIAEYQEAADAAKRTAADAQRTAEGVHQQLKTELSAYRQEVEKETAQLADAVSEARAGHARVLEEFAAERAAAENEVARLEGVRRALVAELTPGEAGA